MIEATPVAGIVGALAAMRDRPDSRPLLKTLDGLPTLVLVGTEDRITPPEGMRAMAAALPGSEFVELDGAGHLAPLERPEEVTRRVREFLTRMAG
jgi:pimeloyl-ACP methyl ester carboxylesterase